MKMNIKYRTEAWQPKNNFLFWMIFTLRIPLIIAASILFAVATAIMIVAFGSRLAGITFGEQLLSAVADSWHES